jgi:hypothetical protein
MRGRLLSPALVAILLLAGCADDGPAGGDLGITPQQPPVPTHALLGASEPGELTAPTFRLAGAIAQGGPAYGAGEPSVWAALDGTLYVAFPGCDRSFYLAGPVLPTDEDCEHGLLFRSDDDAATWTRLNRDGDGRYEDQGEAPSANGDAEVAVDAAGTVYASNLGSGIQVHASTDKGATWDFIGDVVEEGESSDRQWMAAASPGHLIVTWMGSGTDGAGQDQGRAVIVNSTFDGGANWTGSLALGSNIGWLGPVQFDVEGVAAYIPFTQVEGASGPLGVETFSMRVARTLDGGLTWDVVDTGARITANAQGGHWSGVNMAPALDVTGDGTIVVAWSQDINSQQDLTAMGAEVMVVTSDDKGGNWTEPRRISQAAKAIMPWVVGGGGDRFAVTWFQADEPGDPDYVGAVWDVVAAVANGPAEVTYSVIQQDVHQGGICSRGGGCLTTGSDRALLDYFEADLTPDGRLFVAYPADPLTGGKYIEIRVAIQDGGAPLAVGGWAARNLEAQSEMDA